MKVNIKRVLISSAIALMLFSTGIAGYMAIEKWTFMDSVYMTAITLSTVGFGETHALSLTGRVFTIVLIFTGGGYFLYLAGMVMQFVVEGEINAMLGRRKLDKTISKMEKHYIVCGFGRIGRILCQQLSEQTNQIVVLEKDPLMEPKLQKAKLSYMIGDASDESLLIKAGIRRAAHLIAALATDTDNVFLVLTARQLNPEIPIMARASNSRVKAKLYAAGATRVESPYDVGAISMGLKILRPSVSNFLDIALSRKERAIQIEEAVVSGDSEFCNIMLKDSGIRQNYNLIIIAIKKADGQMIFNPSFETFMEPGDTVIAMGRSSNLIKFSEALAPKPSAGDPA